MQANTNISSLLDSEKLKCHIQRRTRMTFWLSGVMLLVYSAYFIAMAWLRGWMESPLIADSVISIGIWFALFTILFSVLTSGFYVWWANNKFDAAQKQLLQELGHGSERS